MIRFLGELVLLILTMVFGSIVLYFIARDRHRMQCSWFRKRWYSALGVRELSTTTRGGVASTQIVLVQSDMCEPYDNSIIEPGSDAYPAIASDLSTQVESEV
jgi:hypothetical protein